MDRHRQTVPFAPLFLRHKVLNFIFLGCLSISATDANYCYYLLMFFLLSSGRTGRTDFKINTLTISATDSDEILLLVRLDIFCSKFCVKWPPPPPLPFHAHKHKHHSVSRFFFLFSFIFGAVLVYARGNETAAKSNNVYSQLKSRPSSECLGAQKPQFVWMIWFHLLFVLPFSSFCGSRCNSWLRRANFRSIKKSVAAEHRRSDSFNFKIL